MRRIIEVDMRLIDAEELVRDLMEQIPLAENVPIFKEIIESQPTAYDVDKVVEALEKQIPIKPIGKNNVCPKCGVIEFGYNEPNYCEWCGQKLKWE